MDKNYYDILNLQRGASSDEIKKSYRKLVRKYHPDVSKEADAADQMQQINLAYETLNDAAKRAEYDQMLDNPHGFAGQGGAGAGGSQYQYYRGHDGAGQSFSEEDLRRHFAQGFGTGGFGTGNGSAGFSGFEDLFGQFGAGFGGGRGRSGQQGHPPHNSQHGYRGEDQHASIEVDIRVAYEGANQQLTLQMPVINANGQQEIQRKTLQVKIPKGMKSGQQIRLSGQGQAGIASAGNAAQHGDLYIEILYRNTDQLRVEGSDVYMTVPVTPWEVALGEKIQVNTLAGTVDVKVPEGAQSGQQLRLKGKGIPAKDAGNLYLVLQVVVPPANTEAAKAAYRQLAEQLAVNPRS